MSEPFNETSTNFECNHFNILLVPNISCFDETQCIKDGNDNPLIEIEKVKVIEEEQIVIPIQSNIPSIFPFAKEPAENIVSPYCVTKTKKTVYRKKKNQKKERMEKPDDIRKKIKVGFHYSLNKRINEILESVNAKKYSFKRLPQEIITCVTKEENKQIMNKTLEEIINSWFCGHKERDKNDTQSNKPTPNLKEKVIDNMKKNLLLII